MRRPRRKRQRVASPVDVPLTEAYLRDIERARRSMLAFDGMPIGWRQFCADYPRTARGSSLAEVLEMSGGDERQAQRLLRQLMPTDAHQ